MALTNTQYEQLMREYSRLQALDHHEMIGRRQAARRKIPGLEELEARIAELAVAQAGADLSGDASGARRLERERHEVSQKISHLLTENGFQPDYLQMHYHCSACQDTGYVEGRKCRCFRRQAISLFYTQPALLQALKDENFSTFRFDCYDEKHVNPATGLSPRENMHRIVKECRLFIDGFGSGAFLLFYGGPGLGKTFLSHCIAKELMDRDYSVLYYSSSSLFDALAKNAFEKDSVPDPFADYVMDCDLLIIDDLGTEMTNSYVSATLFRILNERISRKKSMLISTNLTLPDLADVYSERSFSRITSAFTLLGFYGEDIRIKKKLLTGGHHEESSGK